MNFKTNYFLEATQKSSIFQSLKNISLMTNPTSFLQLNTIFQNLLNTREHGKSILVSIDATIMPLSFRPLSYNYQSFSFCFTILQFFVSPFLFLSFSPSTFSPILCYPVVAVIIIYNRSEGYPIFLFSFQSFQLPLLLKYNRS